MDIQTTCRHQLRTPGNLSDIDTESQTTLEKHHPRTLDHFQNNKRPDKDKAKDVYKLIDLHKCST